jgi:hypothetical protein
MDILTVADAPLVALMFAGGAFAIAGLALMFRRSSGPGLAVFLTGTALLTAPLVLPGRPAATGPPEADEDMPVLSLDGATEAARPPPLPGRVAAVVTIEAREAEPNDNLAAANVATLGTAITGTLGPGDLDYFAIPVPTGHRGEIVVNLVALEGDAELTLFDDVGQALGTMGTRSELSARTVALVRKLDRPRYHVLVLTPAGEATYQLTIAARRR